MPFRAFIIEDNHAVRESLVATLKEMAQIEPVGLAETEVEGKEWLARNDDYWDLAIVDLFLKEGSGLRILEACRRRRPSQKMMVLSNHASPDVRWRCAELGADAVFDKALEIDALVDYCLQQRAIALDHAPPIPPPA